MLQADKVIKKIKPKPTLKALKPGETVIVPRPQYTSLRNTLSALRIEFPEREYEYTLIENGIEVVCLK